MHAIETFTKTRWRWRWMLYWSLSKWHLMRFKIKYFFVCFIIIFNSLFNSVLFVQVSVASLLCMVLVVHHFISMSTKTLLKSLENDCDVFEKAVQISIFVHHNKESHLLEECRSRYAKFLAHHYVEHYGCRKVAKFDKNISIR